MLVGCSWTILGWLSGGPAGPGRLAELGPSPWQLGLVTALEVGVGAVIVVAAGLTVRFLAPAPAPATPATADDPFSNLLG